MVMFPKSLTTRTYARTEKQKYRYRGIHIHTYIYAYQLRQLYLVLATLNESNKFSVYLFCVFQSGIMKLLNS